MTIDQDNLCPCGCEEPMCARCGHSIHSHTHPDYAPACVQCIYEDRHPGCPGYEGEE